MSSKSIIKICGMVIAAAICVALGGCESCSREWKSIESDLGGGLHRKVTLYDYEGEKLREWEGTFDVSENDQECWFDLDGKRVIIQGGIIVNEEL